MRKKISILLCLFFIFVCFAMPGSLKKDLKISLNEKQVQDLSLQGLSLVFYINISNSSSSPYYLSSYDYRFVVNQKEYLHWQTSLRQGIEIDARENTLLSFPLKITYARLFQAVPGVEKEDKALCYLAGTMTFSDGRKEKGKLPFGFSGEFPVFKKPEIEFLSIQINELTIGGADLSFKVKFRNSNGFELLVDSIDYSLSLGEAPVGDGMISGDKNIESHSEKVFSLPLLLNFFEVGKDVSHTLQQSYALCRFKGNVEVRTIWGKVRIPFDKSGKVSIQRAP